MGLFQDKLVPQHPSSRDFPLLMGLFPSLATLFGSAKEWNSIPLGYLQNILIFCQLLLESLSCRTSFLPTVVLMTTLLVVLVVEFL